MSRDIAWQRIGESEKRSRKLDAFSIHEYQIRPETDFDEDVGFWGRKLNEGIWKMVGRLRGRKREFGGMAAVAYGFDSDRYSPSKARKWLKINAAGLGNPPHKRHTFSFRYAAEENEDGTITFRDVQVMEEGIWNEEHWGQEEFAAMVEADGAIHDKVLPPFKLGHTWEGPRYGTVGPLYVSEGKLFTEEIAQVPQELAAMIEQGQYGRMSPEIYTDFTDASTQTTYDQVFWGLALLGVELPAVNTLPALSKLSAKPDGKIITPMAQLDEASDQSLYRLFDIDGNTEPPNRSEDEREEEDMDQKALDAQVAELKALGAKLTAQAEENDKAHTEREAKLTTNMRGMVLSMAVSKLPPDKIDGLKEAIAEMDYDSMDGQLTLLKSLPDVDAGMPTGKGVTPPPEEPKDERPASLQMIDIAREIKRKYEIKDDGETAAIMQREHPELFKQYMKDFEGSPPEAK